MFKISFKLHFLLVSLILNLLLILLLYYYKDKYDTIKIELIKLKNDYEILNKKYTECYTNMEKIKVDYTKRLKEFIRKYNEKHKYNRLKEIPLMRGDKDECEQIKEILDIYREIEGSGYFNNPFNRSVFTSVDKNKN